MTVTSTCAVRRRAGTLGILWLGVLACSPTPPPPDVVLVTWDTVRVDHVGPRESASATPTFDMLARDGVSFSEARSPVPITLPAHTSLLTGLFPASHGVRDNGTFRLDASVPTLGERLTDAGYTAGAFVSAQVLERDTGLARGFAVYDDEVTPHPFVEVVPARRADHTVDAAIRWLEGVEAEAPVFLWVHLYDPHRTWEAPAPWSERFEPYDAEIAFADAQTGRLLGALERLGRLTRSIVAITSDHGEGLGDHEEVTHSYFAYDSTLRVPLLLWAGPALETAWARGARVEGPASLVDLAPTLLEVAGLSSLETDGRSLVASLREGRPVAGRTLPFETVAPAYGYGTAPVFGALTEDDQTWFDLPRRERYDLAVDPDQRENLYTDADATRADAVFAAQPRAWPPETSALEPDAASKAALEALGYVGSSSLPPEDAAPVDPKDRVEVSNFLTADSQRMTPTMALEASAALVARHGALPALARFRAQMFDRLGLGRDAMAALEQGLREHPGHAGLASELDRRREAMARRTTLVEAIRATLEREPQHPRARRDLALTLHQLQDLSGARSLYEAILDENAEDDATRLNLVGLLVAQGHPREALARADSALSRPGHDARLDCAAGRILAWHLDRPQRAVAHLRACRDGGARLTPLDRTILDDAEVASRR